MSLPEDCLEISGDRGISSISWSNDGSRLVVVCQNGKSSNTCIINFNGGSNCWGIKEWDDIYSRADWSPVNESIVNDTGLAGSIAPTMDDLGIKFIRTGRKIELVGPQGNVQKELIDGWSTAWSSDGNEIAFFRWDDERGYRGIASIHPGGSNFRWVYRPPKRGSGGDLEYYKPNFLDAFYGCPFPSKITWSPDQKYFLVSASSAAMCGSLVYKINVNTGKVEYLT